MSKDVYRVFFSSQTKDGILKIGQRVHRPGGASLIVIHVQAFHQVKSCSTFSDVRCRLTFNDVETSEVLNRS